MSTNEKQEFIEVDEYDAKCPSCGASIKFHPASGKLVCPYCHHTEEIPNAELEADLEIDELDFHQAEARSSFRWGEEKKIVICDACAAELIYDALEVANVCPYCGSNHVMEIKDDHSIAPNGIIPFQLTLEQANENFQKWIKGKWFAPNEARQSAKAEAFTGIYLPYWTFDTKTASQYTATYGRRRTVYDKDGKPQTVTDWYRTRGFYQEFIDDHLVLASTRYDAHILSKVEPFYLTNARPYQKEYLHGFVAERYSIGLDDGWKIAKNEIHHYLESQITQHILWKHRAHVVKNLRFSTVHSDITYKYLMLPLWLSTFRYRDKVYQFMVNGQTGKVGGEYPISPLKVTITIFILLLFVLLIYVFFMENSY